MQDIARAKSPERLRVVLTRTEVRRLLERVARPWASPSACSRAVASDSSRARARVKDLDLEKRELLIRDGKGRKDRRTMLTVSLVEPLTLHREATRRQHLGDLASGAGYVALPDAPV